MDCVMLDREKNDVVVVPSPLKLRNCNSWDLYALLMRYVCIQYNVWRRLYDKYAGCGRCLRAKATFFGVAVLHHVLTQFYIDSSDVSWRSRSHDFV